MTETISQPPPTEPSPAELVRAGLCTLCWAPPGRPCTMIGPPGDHLARYVVAVKLGLLSRAEIAQVVGGLLVVADHVVILERPCEDHADDMDRTDAYLALGRDLAIEVDR